MPFRYTRGPRGLDPMHDGQSQFPDDQHVADVAASTAAACVQRGLPAWAVEAAVRGACAAVLRVPSTRTAPGPAPPPPTTYGHSRRQLRIDHQERVQIHIEQARARFAIRREAEVDLHTQLDVIHSAQRAMARRNEATLRSGIGHLQTAVRCGIGSEEGAEFDALRRHAFYARELSRREQRQRVRAELADEEPHHGADEELVTDAAPMVTDVDAHAICGDICDVISSGADEEPMADDEPNYDKMETRAIIEHGVTEERQRLLVELSQRRARASMERAQRAQRQEVAVAAYPPDVELEVDYEHPALLEDGALDDDGTIGSGPGRILYLVEGGR